MARNRARCMLKFLHCLGSLGNPSAKMNDRLEFETHAVELQKQLYRIALQIIAEFIKIV